MNPDDMRAVIADIASWIDDFEEACDSVGTDVGDAWDLLYTIRDECNAINQEGAKA